MPALTADRPPQARIRQGIVLLAGAVIVALLLGDDPRSFWWTPLSLGLVYLAAALTGGRAGSYWATALVLCGWGAAVVGVRQAHPELDTSGLYLLGAGLGAVVAILAARTGVRADPLGAAATVALAGAILAISEHASALTDARTYALAVGAIGLVNVIWGALAGGRAR